MVTEKCKTQKKKAKFPKDISGFFTGKKLLTYMKTLLIIWLIYAFLTGVVIFDFPRKVSPDYIDSRSGRNYYSYKDASGPDRVVLMDNPISSGIARLQIIKNAKESLDISYYKIESGENFSLFMAALI